MTRAGNRPRRPLPAAGALALLLVLLLVPSGPAAGYGYGEQEDPLLTGIPAAIAHGRDGNWDNAAQALGKLSGVVAEVKEKRGRDLSAGISAAASRKDLPALADRLALLVSEVIRIKLRSNVDEEFRWPGTARDRVKAAQKYYDDLLAEKARVRNAKAHRAVVGGFDAAFRAAGVPGFLGSGGVPPDPGAYKKAMASVSDGLAELFGK